MSYPNRASSQTQHRMASTPTTSRSSSNCSYRVPSSSRANKISKNYDLVSSSPRTTGNHMQTAKMTTAPNLPSKKLRTELRRVMSDRVLKITQCSQQHQSQIMAKPVGPSNMLTQTLPSSLLPPSASASAENNNNNNNTESDEKNENNKFENNTSFDLLANLAADPSNLTDKESLIDLVKISYNKIVETSGSIIGGVRAIMSTIFNYTKTHCASSDSFVSFYFSIN